MRGSRAKTRQTYPRKFQTTIDTVKNICRVLEQLGAEKAEAEAIDLRVTGLFRDRKWNAQHVQQDRRMRIRALNRKVICEPDEGMYVYVRFI